MTNFTSYKESIPTYSVNELNESISLLLSRGFAPKFILKASVSKSQIKKGHLWLTLTDGKASVDAVAWSSTIKSLKFLPKQDDGVLIIGKLNFWESRASLVVEVLDIRATENTILRKFELVKDLMKQEGFLDETQKRALPCYPKSIAILTSSPSSALSDILRTARENWPLTSLKIISIPVQGLFAKKIQGVLKNLSQQLHILEIEAIVIARGGGSREDLMLFDDEDICRELAQFPVPVVTGIGHEDDLTVADLVADHRAATPTAAIIALLPNRPLLIQQLRTTRHRFNDQLRWFLRKERQRLSNRKTAWGYGSLVNILREYRKNIKDKQKLLLALSPDSWLLRGFSITRNDDGQIIKDINQITLSDRLTIQLSNGQIYSIITKIRSQE